MFFRGWNDFLITTKRGKEGKAVVNLKANMTGIKEVSLKEVLNAQQYNLAGQKVNNNAKGLVIMNGKKYVK